MVLGMLSPPAPATSAPSQTATGRHQTRQASTSSDAEARRIFDERIRTYTALRSSVEQELPPFGGTANPAALAARQTALSAAIIARRTQAQPGNVFADECRPMFARIVQQDFARRPRSDRDALQKDMPAGAQVEVNTAYPSDLPLTTVPAALLRVLPDLPPDIEYRIVGRDLVLLDTRSTVVVDVLRDVVPS